MHWCVCVYQREKVQACVEVGGVGCPKQNTSERKKNKIKNRYKAEDVNE